MIADLKTQIQTFLADMSAGSPMICARQRWMSWA